MKSLRLRKSNKGQSWYLDFILATTVMIIVGVIFVKLVIGFSEGQQEVQETTDEARTIANTLLSSGFPKNAADENYRYDYSEFRVGLTNDDYKIDNAKLAKLLEFNSDEANYEKLKSIIGTNLDFYVVLQDRTGNFLQDFGHPEVRGAETEDQINSKLGDLNPESGGVKKLSGLIRIIYYDNDPESENTGEFVKMVVRVWE